MLQKILLILLQLLLAQKFHIDDIRHPFPPYDNLLYYVQDRNTFLYLSGFELFSFNFHM